MWVGGWGIWGWGLHNHPSALSLSLTLSLSGRGCESVGKEGPGAFASAEWISLCFWGSRSVPLSWCHCNSRRLTSDLYEFMAALRRSATPPPQPQKFQIATGHPLGGTQAFCCGSRGARGFTPRNSVHLPANPSLYVPPIRGPFPRTTPLFFFRSWSFSAKPFLCSLSLSPPTTHVVSLHPWI